MKQNTFPVLQGHWVPVLERGMNGTRIISFYERLSDSGNEEKVKAQLVFANDAQCLSWTKEVYFNMRNIKDALDTLINGG